MFNFSLFHKCSPHIFHNTSLYCTFILCYMELTNLSWSSFFKLLICNISFLTSQKIPEYPKGQSQVTVFPSFMTHCPPCRHGLLSQGPKPFWQCVPVKPVAHTHLDSDNRSYMGGNTHVLLDCDMDFLGKLLEGNRGHDKDLTHEMKPMYLWE